MNSTRKLIVVLACLISTCQLIFVIQLYPHIQLRTKYGVELSITRWELNFVPRTASEKAIDISVDQCRTYSPVTGVRNLSSSAENPTIPPARSISVQARCVHKFLSDYTKQCQREMIPVAKIVEKTSAEYNFEWFHTVDSQSLPLCPCVPALLCGFVDIDTTDLLKNVSFDIDGNTETSKPVDISSEAGVTEIGGRWRPDWCLPRQRIAIIVPFRNREHHLRVFVRYMRSVLQRQLLDFTIFVVEQFGQNKFNRGSLINTGFLEAKSRGEFDCFVLHDVDLLPLDDRNFYTCSKFPRHVATRQKQRDYKLPYDCYFGGAQAFTGEHFVRVNGYSNMFHGWGGEDDDLLRRIWAQNLTVSDRRPSCISHYVNLEHGRDVGNSAGSHQLLAFYMRPDVYKVDGLNTVKYKVDFIEQRRWYTRLGVRLQTPENDLVSSRLFTRTSALGPWTDPFECKLHTRLHWHSS